MENEENLIVLFIIKTLILYTTQCTHHLNLNFFVFLSSYRNTIINQSARIFSLSYFLIFIRKITWLLLRKFSLFYQIKQESKSEALKKHWILPSCKRNARKEKKTPLKIPTLFSFFPYYFASLCTIWQNFRFCFPFFSHSTRCPVKFRDTILLGHCMHLLKGK